MINDLENLDHPKFNFTNQDHTGPCHVRTGEHTKEMVIFKTAHGEHNYYICQGCVLEVAKWIEQSKGETT